MTVRPLPALKRLLGDDNIKNRDNLEQAANEAWIAKNHEEAAAFAQAAGLYAIAALLADASILRNKDER